MEEGHGCLYAFSCELWATNATNFQDLKSWELQKLGALLTLFPKEPHMVGITCSEGSAAFIRKMAREHSIPHVYEDVLRQLHRAAVMRSDPFCLTARDCWGHYALSSRAPCGTPWLRLALRQRDTAAASRCASRGRRSGGRMCSFTYTDFTGELSCNSIRARAVGD